MPLPIIAPFFVIAIIFGLLFFTSFARDRRQLRNGIYFTITLLFLIGGVLLTFLPSLAFFLALALLFVMIPLLTIALAIFLVSNGVLMIRREGRRLANLLSLLVGLGIFAFMAMVLTSLRFEWSPLWVAVISVTLVLGYVAFLFWCYLLYSLVYSRLRQHRDVDFIVVLGSGLINGKVPPLLASRLDRGRSAFDVLTAQGSSPLLLTSGGQGPDEPLPESRAMADYLIAHGTPEDRIILEDRSRTTAENMRFSKTIMEQRKTDYRCLIVTNNFHVFRAALMARSEEVNGQVIGSPTARYYWPSATIREFVAVFLEHKVINLGICALLALFTPLLAAVVSSL